MKITALIAPAVLASGVLAAPHRAPRFKVHSSEVQTHGGEDLPPITTSVTHGGLIEPVLQPPHKATTTGLAFDSHQDNLKDFPGIASENGQKNKAGASIDVSPREIDTHLEYLLDPIHFPGSPKETENLSKRSTPRFEESFDSQGTNDIEVYENENTQRIVDQLQSNDKYNSHLVQVDAIQEAEDHHRQLFLSGDDIRKHGKTLRDGSYDLDGRYQVKDSSAREPGGKKIAPRSKYPSGLFPNDMGIDALNQTAHSMSDETYVWDEIAKLWQKRATSPDSPGRFPGSEASQLTAHLLLNGDKTFIPKLEAGREALRAVRAYLDDSNRVYPSGKDVDSLPQVFNHAWKVIIMTQLPINFRKDYMKMVNEYMYIVPHKPLYPQDGSGRVPVDLNARSELAPRQKEPYWIDKIVNPEVDNALYRRDDDGELHLPFKPIEDSKDEEENNDDESSFDWMSGSDEEKMDTGDQKEAVEVDLSADSKRGLPSEDETSPSQASLSRRDNGGWFGDISMEYDQDPKDDGAANDAFEFDLSASRKRNLPDKDEGAQYHLSPKNVTYAASKNDTKETFVEALEAMSMVASWYSSQEYVKNNAPGLPEITNPYDEAADELTELKNVTEAAWERFVSKVRNYTSPTPKTLNLTSTFDSAKYHKRDLADNVKKVENEVGSEINKPFDAFVQLLIEITEASDHFAAKMNLTSHSSGKHNSSTSPTHSVAPRSPILSIDGEAAWRKFHGKEKKVSNHRRRDLDNVKEAEKEIESEATKPNSSIDRFIILFAEIKNLTQALMNSTSDASEMYNSSTSESDSHSKRQTTPEDAFSHDTSAEAFSRYILEIAQKQDGNYYYKHGYATKMSRPYPYVGHVTTLEDQEEMRKRLRQDFEEEQDKIREGYDWQAEVEWKEKDRMEKEEEQRVEEERKEEERVASERMKFKYCGLGYDNTKKLGYKGAEADHYRELCRILKDS